MMETKKETSELEDDMVKQRLRRIMLASVPVMILGAIGVFYFLLSSGFTGTIDDTQLGFNAETIKSHFLLMDAESMGLFVLGNLIDYLFMIGYGCLFYSCARVLTWNYRTGSLQKKIGSAFAWIGIVAAICDGIENVFLLSMTADPTGFASWLAIAHSSFALAKFTLMNLSIVWVMSTFILNRSPLASRLVSTANITHLQ
jgi:hypothetical protein